jgi:TonB-dependent SusC/RagA subfamily outer membrane receptor
MRGHYQRRIGFRLAAPLLLAASAACASSGGKERIPGVGGVPAADSGAAYGETRLNNRGRAAKSNRVTQADIDRAGDTNLAAFIESRLPGVRVVNSQGNMAVIITGMSFNSNVGALVLVDGTEGSINSLTLRDISSMEVLKDSAASVYGVRGANGVLLITTRKR